MQNKNELSGERIPRSLLRLTLRIELLTVLFATQNHPAII